MGPKARYAALYATLAGRKGRMFPWHFQWLSIYALERDLRRILPRYRGYRLRCRMWHAALSCMDEQG